MADDILCACANVRRGVTRHHVSHGRDNVGQDVGALNTMGVIPQRRIYAQCMASLAWIESARPRVTQLKLLTIHH
jgi:hypothetical protein